MKTSIKYYFKPHDKMYDNFGEFDNVRKIFFDGELTEDYALHAAKEAIHSFWLNYQTKENKISKPEFDQIMKEFVNQLLEELA